MKILVLLMVIISLPASAAEIKLDDTWLPKLAQLCDAARFGSRMMAEPICNELAILAQKAQAEEKAKEEKK